MNARGVIEVVVATVDLGLGVLNTATYTIVILVAIVTSVMAPPLLRGGDGPGRADRRGVPAAGSAAAARSG